jgi:hypothetical protein
MTLLKLVSIFLGVNHSAILDPKYLSRNVPESFRDHYERLIFPKVHTFEKRRIEALKYFRKNLFIAIPITPLIITAGFFLVIWMDDYDGLAALIAVFAIFGAILFLWHWALSPITGYKSSIKEEVYPNIFSYFGTEFIYKRKSLMEAEIFSNAGIVPRFITKKCEDYIKGRYNGALIELTEAQLLTLRRRYDLRSQTVFRGYLIRLNMKKKFSGHTAVRNRKGLIYKIYSWIHTIHWFPAKISELDKVRFEDPVVQKKFEVRSSDQVEARYLLTPTFMKSLIDLEYCFGKKTVSCAFYDNDLLISVKYKSNKFEVGSVFNAMTFVEESKFILEEMNTIFSIIDILQENEKTVV